MGNNVDLCKMLGLPEEVVCPECSVTVPTYFHDYDIDYGNPNPSDGCWVLNLHCGECGHRWAVDFDLRIKWAGGERTPYGCFKCRRRYADLDDAGGCVR